MTAQEELETLAKNCEELALDAQNNRDDGLKRAHLSVAYRIRHAVKKLPGNVGQLRQASDFDAG